MDDARLIARFEAGTLPAFPHEDHVRVAFLEVRAHGRDEAVRRVGDGIRAMAIAIGALDKFHMTRTVAWIHLVDAALRGDESPDSAAFLAAHPQLLRRDLLNDHYTPGRLDTTLARSSFVEPDLAPLY